MKMPVMTSEMQERKTEAADFLVDTRNLPPEIRWKVQGMVELINFLNETTIAQPSASAAHSSA